VKNPLLNLNIEALSKIWNINFNLQSLFSSPFISSLHFDPSCICFGSVPRLFGLLECLRKWNITVWNRWKEEKQFSATSHCSARSQNEFLQKWLADLESLDVTVHKNMVLSELTHFTRVSSSKRVGSICRTSFLYRAMPGFELAHLNFVQKLSNFSKHLPTSSKPMILYKNNLYKDN